VSLSLVIAINVVADVVLLGGLAYAMSHPARLVPHISAGEQLVVRRIAGADRRSWRRPRDRTAAPTRAV
jgi:hypothetical protein